MLSVIGTGYLGATHGACMAELGFDVIGIDTDATKITLLSQGELPFYEPGLDDLLRKHVASGKLRFSTNFADLAQADVHFICVGTPQRKDGNAADLTYVNAALEGSAEHAKPGSLIVGKSTVPVGTADGLSARLAEINPHVELAWNPEFLREGFAVEDTLRPNRLVVGVQSARAEEQLRDVYAALLKNEVPWISADLRTAELVKVAANSFLATKISFINAMAEICDAAGGDVTVLAKAIGYDPRIGNRFLQAGIGFGGGCLPKDIRAFMARAEELGADQALEFLRDIDSINLRARSRIIDVAAEYGDLKNKKVLVLGAAFKPDSDDVRDSPALDIAYGISQRGARVVVNDPKAMAPAAKRFPDLEFTDDLLAGAQDAHLILHLTEWKEYRALTPADFAKVVANKVIIDGRNALDGNAWRDAGFIYRAPGRPTLTPKK
ncbi:MAG: UDP-glucose/GDP-mannose dehydrogenase family protein [Actinobacteria bacterium]|nr:UDP-glucose/GDP-mannose dehydrogenase family protein [Actinomycetota bacterium]